MRPQPEERSLTGWSPLWRPPPPPGSGRSGPHRVSEPDRPRSVDRIVPTGRFRNDSTDSTDPTASDGMPRPRGAFIRSRPLDAVLDDVSDALLDAVPLSPPPPARVSPKAAAAAVVTLTPLRRLWLTAGRPSGIQSSAAEWVSISLISPTPLSTECVNANNGGPGCVRTETPYRVWWESPDGMASGHPVRLGVAGPESDQRPGVSTRLATRPSTDISP